MKDQSLKKILSWILIVFLGIAILSLLAFTKAAINWSNSLLPARTIIVSGEGESEIKPDIANISFAVVSEGSDIVSLQNENNGKINNAIKFLKDEAVNDKDIKTSDYNLSPRYRYEPKTGKSYIDGYQLIQTISVKVRNLDQVSTILGRLPSIGINQINGPNFLVDDIEKYLDQARAEAFQNAFLKARQLAILSGVSLGRVITFNESRNQPPIIFARSMEAKGGGDPVLPEIEPGTEEVKVIVNVTYEIR